MNLTGKGNFHSFWFAFPRRPPNALPASCCGTSNVTFFPSNHDFQTAVPQRALTQLASFRGVAPGLNRVLPHAVCCSWCHPCLFVALVLTFLNNVLLLIISQGPPVLVEFREYFPIRCTNAGFWAPFLVELLYLLWLPVSAEPPRIRAAAIRQVL